MSSIWSLIISGGPSTGVWWENSNYPNAFMQSRRAQLEVHILIYNLSGQMRYSTINPSICQPVKELWSANTLIDLHIHLSEGWVCITRNKRSAHTCSPANVFYHPMVFYGSLDVYGSTVEHFKREASLWRTKLMLYIINFQYQRFALSHQRVSSLSKWKLEYSEQKYIGTKGYCYFRWHLQTEKYILIPG